MWDYIINIHQSKLLITKIKECRINESFKKKVFHNNYKKKHGQFTFYTKYSLCPIFFFCPV